PAARHGVDQYLSPLEPLGVRARSAEFSLPTDAGAESRVDEFLASTGLKPQDRLVVLNPGAGRPDKRWPIARYRDLARSLAADASAAVLVTSCPTELCAALCI